MSYSLDSNHTEIVNAFKKLRALVIDNAKVKRQEPGQLDIWVGLANPYGGPGIWLWVEIKTETGNLRPSQEQMIRDCQDKGLPVEVVRTTADVERIYYKYLEMMK